MTEGEKRMNTVHSKLKEAQARLKAPKGQYNEYGKYNYRSCEDILEAVKPILNELGMTLILSDRIVEIGGRIYIEATATITDCESGEAISNTAYAREEEVKKGMDSSQITGSCSSFARKYALNGILLCDDTKDADTRDNREEEDKKTEKKAAPKIDTKASIVDEMNTKISVKDVDVLMNKASDEKIPVSLICELYNVKILAELTVHQFKSIKQNWSRIREKSAALHEKVRSET